jgi:hypothetical protein
MNIVLSMLLFIILLYYVNYILENFDQTTSVNNTTTSVNNTTTSVNNTTIASKTPEINYFELNNQAKNLVNNYKYETQLREISSEEEQMRNNVRKIQTHADNVLAFTDLNKDYLEKLLLKNSS